MKTLVLVLSLTAGNFSQFGYRSPYLALGTGIESRHPHVLVIAGAGFSPTAKIQAGNGYDLSAGGTLFGKAGPLIAGGGMSWGRTSNSLWTKSATRPSIAAGIDLPAFRLVLSRDLRSAGDPNHLTGWTAGIGYNVSRHVRLGFEIFKSSFISSDGSSTPGSASAFSATVSYQFWR